MRAVVLAVIVMASGVANADDGDIRIIYSRVVFDEQAGNMSVVVQFDGPPIFENVPYFNVMRPRHSIGLSVCDGPCPGPSRDIGLVNDLQTATDGMFEFQTHSGAAGRFPFTISANHVLSVDVPLDLFVRPNPHAINHGYSDYSIAVLNFPNPFPHNGNTDHGRTSLSAVPEPSTLALASFAASALVALRFRGRRFVG